MTTYADNDSPLPVGLPLTEVSPATVKYNFSVELMAAPSISASIGPGGTVSFITPNQTNWIIHTRSVLSWSFVTELPLGVNMLISLGPSEYLPLAYIPPMWLPVVLQGEGVWNVCSGLELPGNTFMRIQLTNADPSGPNNVFGSIYLRGL